VHSGATTPFHNRGRNKLSETRIKFADRPPTWLELESVRPLKPDVEEITSLPPDTVKRRFPNLIVKLSARRVGMKLKHALAIANGTAEIG
jgi:hypothetical protein